MQGNSLFKIWEDELTRIIPQRDPSDFSDIINILQDYVAKLLEKIFNAGKNLPSSHVTAKWLLIGIAGVIFAVLIYLLWRRFGIIARKKAESLLSGRKQDPLAIEYSLLVSGGDYSRAMRLFVRAAGETLRLPHRTFAELFYANTSEVLNRIRIVYGKALHLGSDVAADDLRTLEDQANVIYPSFRKFSRRKKGGRS